MTDVVNSNHIDLLVNVTANTVTDAIQVSGFPQAAFFAYGNFSAATVVAIEASPDKTNWFRTDDSTFTEKTWINGALGEFFIRGVVEGADGSTNVSLKIRPIVTSVAQI